MTSSVRTPAGDPLHAVEATHLTQLVDTSLLSDLCGSFSTSFGVAVRIYASDEQLLASAPDYGEAPTAHELGPGHACPIVYDGRSLGRIEVQRLPKTRMSVDIDKLTAHLVRVLDVVLFSGHRALLASTIHLAATEESFRELEEKTGKLQQAYDRLKELDRLKSTFLATMSHELRTPLTSIIGYSEMLASGMAGELNPTQREFVNTVRIKGDHLLELILTLLDVGKLEQGQLRLTLGVVDGTALVEDVLRTVTPSAAEKGVRLARKLERQLPKLRADEVRLRQVLLNLVDNAIKFTPNAGTVTVEARRLGAHELGLPSGAGTRGAWVQLRVCDTGIGIPSSEHARIFDPFYQVDGSSTREHGGVGLGLSIVKRLVEAHGGTISLDSAPGRGSTFSVSIPAVE